jgi:AhpD family alkylhydroperoxidase
MLNVTPSLNNAFMTLAMEVFRDGALSAKTKELIAIAASLTAGCGKCALSHTLGARQLGATDAEIREAIGVAEVIAAGSVRSLAGAIEVSEPSS